MFLTYFRSKNVDFGLIFEVWDPELRQQCCSERPSTNAATLDTFWNAFLSGFAWILGANMGSQKGANKNNSSPFFDICSPRNEVWQIVLIVLNFVQIVDQNWNGNLTPLLYTNDHCLCFVLRQEKRKRGEF